MKKHVTNRRTILHALALPFLLSGPLLNAANAGEVALDTLPLSAGEIEELLSGNTIAGDWGGAYKQYYAADGTTAYVPEGGNVGIGKWRVNAETNAYESWWESTGWTPYKVVGADGYYFWVDAKGDTYPFEVLKGKQVDW